MRYELTDYEWAAIRPMLPNKPCGVPRVNDRRVLNGIFWVLRSGATTCYNRFVRWRQAGMLKNRSTKFRASYGALLAWPARMIATPSRGSFRK
jgi:transposase